MKLTYLKLIFTSFILLIYADDDFDYNFMDRKLAADLELVGIDLEEQCTDMSVSLKNALLGKQEGFQDKVNAEREFGRYLRLQAASLKNLTNIPEEIQYNWTVLSKPGDSLLPEDDWNTLTSFYNSNEELASVVKVPCVNDAQDCYFKKRGLSGTLKSTKNPNVTQETWSSWQEVFLSSKNQFSSILQLTNKAASKNDESNAQNYWEMLTEYPEGYSKIKSIWEEIEPLYKRLFDFIKVRLFKFYGIQDNSTEVPVYLLGSNFGSDWSNIANIILPHPQMLHDVEVMLKTKTVKQIYRMAENMTVTMNMGHFGKGFWSNSLFNFTNCDNLVLNYCSIKYSEVLSCDDLDWSSYLDVHEKAMEIILAKQDYESLVRRNLRYSAFDEAVINLGSLMAIDNLLYYNLIEDNHSADDNLIRDNKMTKLLLVALRVLPKLPYYLVADTWRLGELENPSENYTKSWWELRQSIQGVKGFTNLESDFLDDPYIISNKPYLSKFLGTVLQFQFLARLYAQDNHLATLFGEDSAFPMVVHERSSKDWLALVGNYYGIYEISAESLLEYFRPLDEYFNEAPLKQTVIKQRIITTPKALEATSESFTTIAPLIQNDQVPLGNISATNETAVNSLDTRTTNLAQTIGMYVGIAVSVSAILIMTIIFIKVRLRKKARTNNRRFET